MSNYCKECGTELSGAKFCPNCGTAEGDVKNVTESTDLTRIVSIGLNGKGIRYAIMIIFSALYLLLLSGDWVKLSVPFLDDMEFSIYSLMKGCYYLFGEIEGGVVEILVYILVILLFGLGVYTAYLCIVTILRSVKADNDAAHSLSRASCISVFISALLIGIVMFLKGIIEMESENIFESAAIMDVISFTKLPVVLFIAGIVGKLISDKCIYLFWKDEH